MRRKHFHYSIAEENARAARDGAHALLVVVAGCLMMAFIVLLSQADRVDQVLRGAV